MNEKISDIPVRRDKIRKLKEKILLEIHKYLNGRKNYIKRYLACDRYNIDDWNFIVTQEYALLKLKDYIEDSRSFWSSQWLISEKDIIVYYVSDKYLNIWLQDDYNFVSDFLSRIERESFDVYEMLNDRYFGSEFMNIYEEITYDHMMNEL